MKAENQLKITRFLKQYENKSTWQIETQLKTLIEEISKDETDYALQSAVNAIRNNLSPSYGNGGVH